MAYALARKELTTEVQKRGRANKSTGYQSEKKLEKLLQSWGLNCERVIGSGALAKISKGKLASQLAGDLRLAIQKKAYKIENKRRQSFKKWRELAEGYGGLIIGKFCVIVNQEAFRLLLCEKIVPNPNAMLSLPDENMKWLHDFFEQDNADIVSLDERRKKFVFAIRMGVWKKLCINMGKK